MTREELVYYFEQYGIRPVNGHCIMCGEHYTKHKNKVSVTKTKKKSESDSNTQQKVEQRSNKPPLVPVKKKEQVQQQDAAKQQEKQGDQAPQAIKIPTIPRLPPQPRQPLPLPHSNKKVPPPITPDQVSTLLSEVVGKYQAANEQLFDEDKAAAAVVTYKEVGSDREPT